MMLQLFLKHLLWSQVFSLCLIWTGACFGQNFDHPLYELEERIKEGDKDALFEIALYFDSGKTIVLYIDLKEWPTKEAAVAKRIVLENCQFLDTEIMINDSTSGKEFFDFLAVHRKELFFSPMASCFMLQPLEKWEARFELRELSTLRKEEIAVRIKELMDLEWVKQSQLGALIAQKDSKALLVLAAELFSHRRNDNQFNYPQPYLQLLHWLTGIEIGVENGHGKMSWVNDYYFDHKSRFNLLIFFAKHYQQFTWNEQEPRFVNPQLYVRPLEKEEYLFQFLSHDNDSLAMDAFIQLSNCPPDRVSRAASEYFDYSMVTNNSIPHYPCGFLKQLAVLTAYCRDQEIDFHGSAHLSKKIAALQKEIPTIERAQLENELIQTITLEEITAFEYWAIVYQNAWGLSKSAKRILDDFYHKHWLQLIANPKQLDCYLKKSKLFSALGIIGYYNDYLKRFGEASEDILMVLKNHKTLDADVQAQINRILSSKK
jgi:uncharacterized protein YqcC (DUF446 family)